MISVPTFVHHSSDTGTGSSNTLLQIENDALNSEQPHRFGLACQLTLLEQLKLTKTKNLKRKICAKAFFGSALSKKVVTKDQDTSNKVRSHGFLCHRQTPIYYK